MKPGTHCLRIGARWPRGRRFIGCVYIIIRPTTVDGLPSYVCHRPGARPRNVYAKHLMPIDPPKELDATPAKLKKPEVLGFR
jgi:hypothetical protein